mgnify:CR=1 FL=1
MLRIALTGSSGFVGKAIIRQLVDDPEVDKILALDLAPCEDHPKVTWLNTDVRDPVLAEQFMSFGVNAVIHLAFIIEPKGKPDLMYDVNVNGTANVLRAAAASHADRFMMMSSLAIYGVWPDNPTLLTEDLVPRPNPDDAYGQQKLQAEFMCHAFAEEHPEVAMSIMRPCGIMGPKLGANYLLMMLKAPFLPLPQKARGRAQFIHVDDVARLASMLIKQRARGIFNAAERSTLPWRAIYELLGRPIVTMPRWLLSKLIGFLHRLRILPVIPSQMLMVSYPAVLSTERTAERVGFEAHYPIHTTLEQTVESLKQFIPIKRGWRRRKSD